MQMNCHVEFASVGHSSARHLINVCLQEPDAMAK
ncbi:Transcription initiation factor TFIID subunit 2 [Frankliniella fusca]|uniref:Transcription initiation factor TFIID subunit 2 n=1 Tax=Frankliniella fusca TaxID=407009 RepID=A0AAE1GZJ6_9NEOP|nr:Transcription initiation factor TFIID subunit 2 [Frankliniella fusca]